MTTPELPMAATIEQLGRGFGFPWYITRPRLLLTKAGKWIAMPEGEEWQKNKEGHPSKAAAVAFLESIAAREQQQAVGTKTCDRMTPDVSPAAPLATISGTTEGAEKGYAGSTPAGRTEQPAAGTRADQLSSPPVQSPEARLSAILKRLSRWRIPSDGDSWEPQYVSDLEDAAMLLMKSSADPAAEPAGKVGEKELPDSWGHWLDKDGNHWWIFGKPGKFMAQCLDPETGIPDDETPPTRLQELTGLMRSGWRKLTPSPCPRCEELAAGKDCWQETAEQHCRNEDFYSGLVRQIGETFGDAAKTSDDGSLQQDVLALKVPELVRELTAERDRLKLELTLIRLPFTDSFKCAAGDIPDLTEDSRGILAAEVSHDLRAGQWDRVRWNTRAMAMVLKSLNTAIDECDRLRGEVERSLILIRTRYGVWTDIFEAVEHLINRIEFFQRDNEEMGKIIGCEHVEDGHARCLDQVLAEKETELAELRGRVVEGGK